MLKLISKITIDYSDGIIYFDTPEDLQAQLKNNAEKTPIVFDFVNEVEMDSSWENLTDTAKITIPRKLNFEGQPIAIGENALLKRGMSIKIEIGYDNDLKTVFTGFISRVNVAVPMVIECEDRMYLLKKNTLANKSYESVSLSTLLKYIIPSTIDYDLDGFEYTNLGKVRISNNATTAQVLTMLRKNYDIYSFFRNDILYVGVAYHQKLQKTKTFGFEQNIIDDKNLEWKDALDEPIKVKGTFIKSDNTKLEYTFPSTDTEGQQITFTMPGESQADLEAKVKRKYDSEQYTGYRGSFTTFGEPFTNHGDLVQFTGNKLPERNDGKYLVKSVKRTFGQGGYRQIIEPNIKIT